MAHQARSKVPSAAANGKGGHSLISNEKFRQLYGLALRLRTGRGGQNGRGAALASVVADLRRGDGVVMDAPPSLNRVPGGEWPDVEIATSGSFAERVIAAVSGAVADRMKKSGRVTVIFSSGPESTDPRTDAALADAREIAEKLRLPVLFVEDWQGAEGGAPPPERRSKGPAPLDATPAMPVDAQDVIALYRVAHESIARAREGTGPTRIQCVRWIAPGKNGKAADAVAHLEQWLEARGLPAQEWRRAIAADISK